MCGFCNVRVCVCVGFFNLCVCVCVWVGVWVLKCVGVGMCGFCNVWVCVYVWGIDNSTFERVEDFKYLGQI